ncbi:hypothetical protein [Pandoraea sp. XY-2]|uniref:hypothetical protein n=1 Tax=Pandoraea sp. XY-2 TaxID=2518599 RepID=UPI00101B06CD|nr:hypothetical protein DRB87_20630 [Pandoraea sp. XY-2]
MKTQIDNLVRGIRHDLAQPSPAVPELATFFRTIGADGLSKAVAQRAILSRWAEDTTLPRMCAITRNSSSTPSRHSESPALLIVQITVVCWTVAAWGAFCHFQKTTAPVDWA